MSNVGLNPAQYAEAIASSLHERYYPNQRWEPLRGDVIGLLTQIDNMTTGIHGGWQPIETAPKDKQFLASLSNGWVVILREPPNCSRYGWYRGGNHVSIPVARTHDEISDDCLVATHWMPLPNPPEDSNE